MTEIVGGEIWGQRHISGGEIWGNRSTLSGGCIDPRNLENLGEILAEILGTEDISWGVCIGLQREGRLSFLFSFQFCFDFFVWEAWIVMAFLWLAVEVFDPRF